MVIFTAISKSVREEVGVCIQYTISQEAKGLLQAPTLTKMWEVGLIDTILFDQINVYSQLDLALYSFNRPFPSFEEKIKMNNGTALSRYLKCNSDLYHNLIIVSAIPQDFLPVLEL